MATSSTSVSLGMESSDEDQLKWHRYGFTRSSLQSVPTHAHRGLLNQGATCYLNSFLQTLFLAPEMRRAILQWRPVDKDGAPASAVSSNGSGTSVSSPRRLGVVSELQRLFLRLLYASSGSVSTTSLTSSFGWHSAEIWQQHDVQEFIQKLYERMMAEDKELREQVQKINHGTLVDYVQCTTCKTRKAKSQPFLTLALECKGMKSVEESLAAFVRSEHLYGENAYRCGVCDSKQPATKGVALVQCPPLLSLQLKRFDMDWNSGTRVKISTPLKLSPTLNVKPFISNEESNAAPSVSSHGSTEYELFSVLIHSGSANGGHYFAYTKDLWLRLQSEGDEDQKQNHVDAAADSKYWFECNDSSVTRLSQQQVKEMFEDPLAAKNNVQAAAIVAPTAPHAPPPEATIASPAPPAPVSTITQTVPSAPSAPSPPNAPAPPIAPPAPTPSVPSAPLDAPPAPPGPPSAPSASLKFSSPTRAATSHSSATSTFLSDFAVPEAPGLDAALASKRVEASAPSSGAYMLVYRRVGTKQEDKVELKSTDWRAMAPQELVDEIEAERRALESYRAHIAHEDSFLTVTVHYPMVSQESPIVSPSGSPISTISTSVKVPFVSSVRDLISSSLRKLESEQGFSAHVQYASNPDAHRVRHFEPNAKPARIGEYLTMDANDSRNLRDMSLRNSMSLFIQPSTSLPSDGSVGYLFPSVEVPTIRLRMVRFDSDHDHVRSVSSPSPSPSPLLSPDAPILIDVPFDVTVKALKQRLIEDGRLFDSEIKENAGAVTVDRINLVLCPSLQDESSIVEISKHSSDSTPVERVMGGMLGTIIYVELLPLSDPPSSLLVPWLHLQSHLLPLMYNRIGSEDLDQKIIIDDRISMMQFKQQLAQALAGEGSAPLPMESFRLLREFGGMQYKDLSKSVLMSHLGSVGSIIVEAGPPMQAGDSLFRVFIHRPELVPAAGSSEWNAAIVYDPETNEPTNSPEELAFVFIGNVALNERMTLAQVTSAISALPQSPPASLIRIRDRLENSLTNIWYADRTLKQNCPGARDFYPLVVQSLSAPEQVRSTDLLISLRHWRPSRLELSPADELALPRTLKVSELRQRIADRLNVELSHMTSDPASVPILTGSDVELAVAAPHELRDLSLMPSLAWSAKLSEFATLSGAPWRLRHGDTVCYKLKGADKLGSALTSSDQASRALLFNLQYGSGSSSTTGQVRSSRGGGGPELHIFSPDEIILREEQAAAEKQREQEKKMREAQELQVTLASLQPSSSASSGTSEMTSSSSSSISVPMAAPLTSSEASPSSCSTSTVLSPGVYVDDNGFLIEYGTPPPRFSCLSPSSLADAWRFMDENGFCVIRDVVREDEILHATELLWKHLEHLPPPFDKIRRNDVESWNVWPGRATIGMLHEHSIGQSEFQWYLRGIPAVKDVFASLWNTRDLLVSFDAAGVFRPWHPNYHPEWKTHSGWFHCDQNPIRKPNRACVQGQVNLMAANSHTGGLVVIPGAFKRFQLLTSECKDPNHLPDFIVIPKEHEILKSFSDHSSSSFLAKCSKGVVGCLVQCGAGDMILWDSRTPHCNMPAVQPMELNWTYKVADVSKVTDTDASTVTVASSASASAPSARASASTSASGSSLALNSHSHPFSFYRMMSLICMTPRAFVPTSDLDHIISQRLDAVKLGQTTNHWPHEFNANDSTVRPPTRVEPGADAHADAESYNSSSSSSSQWSKAHTHLTQYQHGLIVGRDCI